MTITQRIFTIALLAVAAFALQAKADYRDDSRAVKVSGGENGQGWGDGWKKGEFDKFFVDLAEVNLV